jgi:hypothetical protein
VHPAMPWAQSAGGAYGMSCAVRGVSCRGGLLPSTPRRVGLLPSTPRRVGVIDDGDVRGGWSPEPPVGRSSGRRAGSGRRLGGRGETHRGAKRRRRGL